MRGKTVKQMLAISLLGIMAAPAGVAGYSLGTVTELSQP